MDWYKYLDEINKRTATWSTSSTNMGYVSWDEMRVRTEELSNRLRNAMVHGNWIIKDETNNSLEPIGIEEII